MYTKRHCLHELHFVAHANNVVSYTLERFRLCPSVHTGRSSMQCVVRASPIQHHRHRPLGGPDPCCSAFPHHPSLHDSRPATILIHAQQCDGANQCRCPGASRGSGARCMHDVRFVGVRDAGPATRQRVAGLRTAAALLRLLASPSLKAWSTWVACGCWLFAMHVA